MKSIFTKRLVRSEIFHMVLIVLLAGVGGYALYHNQHEKVVKLASANTKLSSANKSQATKIMSMQTSADNLSKQNVELQNQISEYKKKTSIKVSQPVYSLSVNSVKQYFSPALLADDTYTLLVVDVSIKNTGNAAGYVSPSDFTLKDNDNVSQQTVDEWAGHNQNVYLPPPQPVKLSSQRIDVNDTVRGSLVFHVLTSQTSFILKYNSKSLPVTVTGKLTTQG
jgi:hypothetical protein